MARSLQNSFQVTTRNCTSTRRPRKTSGRFKGKKLKGTQEGTTMKWRRGSTRMPVRSAAIAGKKRPIARTRNRSGLLMSRWQDLWGATTARRPGGIDHYHCHLSTFSLLTITSSEPLKASPGTTSKIWHPKNDDVSASSSDWYWCVSLSSGSLRFFFPFKVRDPDHLYDLLIRQGQFC